MSDNWVINEQADKKADHSSTYLSASGWLPPGAALSVHWLAGLQGHTSLQTLHPPVGAEVGQVAGAVWRWRREDCGPLPVSSAPVCTHTHAHTRTAFSCHNSFANQSWHWFLSIFFATSQLLCLKPTCVYLNEKNNHPRCLLTLCGDLQ